MSIEVEERNTYEAMWGFEQYAVNSPGERFVDAFLEMAGRSHGQGLTVLDAGCGSGKGALALRNKGFAVQMCDLTAEGLIAEARELPFRQACLWRPLPQQLGYLRGGQFDFVVCCDVLEHVPPQLTMLVIARLLEVTRTGLFLSIYLQPDEFGAFIGKPLHQTVQSFVWWRDALNELATVVECRDLASTGLYFVEPRR